MGGAAKTSVGFGCQASRMLVSVTSWASIQRCPLRTEAASMVCIVVQQVSYRCPSYVAQHLTSIGNEVALANTARRDGTEELAGRTSKTRPSGLWALMPTPHCLAAAGPWSLMDGSTTSAQQQHQHKNNSNNHNHKSSSSQSSSIGGHFGSRHHPTQWDAVYVHADCEYCLSGSHSSFAVCPPMPHTP